MSRRIRFRAVLGTLAMAGALVVTSMPAEAQQRPREGARREQADGVRGRMQDPAERIERRVQMLTERLELSSEQAAQVKSVLQRQHTQMRAFMEQQGFTPGERPDRAQRTRPDSAQRAAVRAQMETLRAETEAGIERILNAEQKQKYDALQERMRERRGDRPNRPPRRLRG